MFIYKLNMLNMFFMSCRPFTVFSVPTLKYQSLLFTIILRNNASHLSITLRIIAILLHHSVNLLQQPRARIAIGQANFARLWVILNESLLRQGTPYFARAHGHLVQIQGWKTFVQVWQNTATGAITLTPTIRLWREIRLAFIAEMGNCYL